MVWVTRIFRPFRNWWDDHFETAELVLPALIAVALAVWIYGYGGWPHVETIMSGKRSSIYGTLATLLGSLLGFVIAAVAIVIGESSRLAFIREAGQLTNLLNVFQMATKALALGTIAALTGLIFDSDADPIRWILVLVGFATILAGLRVARAVWVLSAVVRHLGRTEMDGVHDHPLTSR